MDRVHPQVVVDRPSPNCSRRSGGLRMIVVHATEAPRNGANNQDLQNLAGWFADPASQVSSHVATNGDGWSARFVGDGRKAWHVAGYNDQSLGIEQVGHTADRRWPEKELHETARWIAKWSREHSIPIRKAKVWRGRVIRKGVARHSDLGVIGGNHGDPGDGYDLARVLQLAAQYRQRQ